MDQGNHRRIENPHGWRIFGVTLSKGFAPRSLISLYYADAATNVRSMFLNTARQITVGTAVASNPVYVGDWSRRYKR